MGQVVHLVAALAWCVAPAAAGTGSSPSVAGAADAQAPATSIVALGNPGGAMVVGSSTVPSPAVRVVDAGGNGVAGETVTFTVTAGGGQVAPAVIANLDAVYRTGGSPIVTNEAKAVLFTTGPVAVSVSRVAVMLNGPTTTYPASIQARVALHAVSGGNPAAVLAQSEVVSLTLADSRVWHVFTLPALTLAASQSYALVVSNPGATGFRWANTDSSFAPSAFGGATYDGARFWNVTTAQWDAASAANAFVLGADLADATAITVTTSSTGVAALGRWALGTTVGNNTVTAAHAVGSQTFSGTGIAGSASRLVVTRAPMAAASGAALTTQPVAQVSDAFGNVITSDSATVVTAGLASGAGGQLGGPLTAATVNGVATFSGLTLAGVVGTAYTLRFTAPGLTAADAVGLTVTGAGPATQAAVAAGQAQTATVSTAVGMLPAVVVRDAMGNGVPGVTVTFAVGSGGGSVTGATVPTNASGVATVDRWTLGAMLGVNTLTATATGLTGSPLTFTATAVAVIPTAPITAQVTPRDRSLVVGWQPSAAVAGAAPTGYVVQYRPLPDGLWTDAELISAQADAPSQQTTIAGLTNGTAYEVRVASENSGGRSPWTTPVAASPYRIDLRVAEVQPLTAASYVVTLQWTYEGPATTGFVLEGGAAGGTPGAVGVGAVTLSRQAVEAGRYIARVRLAEDAASAHPSNVVDITTAAGAVPATPTDLRATVDGPRVTLAWVPNFTAGMPTQTYVVVSGVADPLPVGLGSSVTFTDVPEGEYEVRVATWNEAGASALSSPVTVVVPGGCIVPETPAWVSVGVEGRVGIAWWQTAPAGGAATDYLVTVEGLGEYATGGASRLAGLLEPGTYRISVRAQNACGISAPSAVQVLRVP